MLSFSDKFECQGCDHVEDAWAKYIVPNVNINNWHRDQFPRSIATMLTNMTDRISIISFLMENGIIYRVSPFKSHNMVVYEHFYCESCFSGKYGFLLNFKGREKLLTELPPAVFRVPYMSSATLACCIGPAKFESKSKYLRMNKLKKTNTLNYLLKATGKSVESLLEDIVCRRVHIFSSMVCKILVCDKCSEDRRLI